MKSAACSNFGAAPRERKGLDAASGTPTVDGARARHPGQHLHTVCTRSDSDCRRRRRTPFDVMKRSHGYTLDHFCVAGSSDEEDEMSEDLVATTVSTTRDRKKPRRYAEVEDAPASRWTEHNIAAPEPEQEDDESSEAESEDAESVHSDCVSVEDDESEDDEAVMRAPRRVTPVPALPKDDGEPKMRKQKGFLYFSALNRGAAWAEVGAENPDMSAEEKTRVVMKKLGEMWAELDDAAKQKWKDDAPMVAVKPKKAKKKGGSAAMDAAAAAQRKGLPAGWTASKKIGARWTYVAPDGEKFTSLASAETAAAKKNPSHDAKPVPKATGHWTAAEHDEFLKCLDIYGREWKKVAERITTRTAAQIRSHAQKYFKKIEAAGEGAPRAAKPAQQPAAADGAPQIPAETLAGALGALDDMLRALRSKRARYEDETPSETGSDEAAPLEKRPRAASEGLVIPQAKRSRANSDDRAPGLRRRVTCDDLRALEALELLREAAGGAF